MRTDVLDASVGHYDDPVGIYDGIDPLRDYYLGRTLHLTPQCLADLRVRRGVDGAGRVVEYDDLRILKQGSCYAQALLLTAGEVVCS